MNIVNLLYDVADEYYPFYSWIWNGKIEKTEIITQLTKMKEAGVVNIYIISESKNFRPVYMPTYAEPEYLSNEYMELFSFAVEEAQRQGMHLWIYDEDGWPSGSCGGKTAKTRENLRIKKFVKEGNTFVLKDTSGDKYYPNLMLEEATNAFIEETHEKYKNFCSKNFGKSITGVFTDEPHIDFYSYDAKIAENFRKEYGYDIEKYLKEEMNSTQSRETKLAWHEYCTNLFAENYFGKIKEWCKKNNLMFTGHVNMDNTGEFVNSCGNILQILRKFDIPGIDVIFRQIFPDKEGETVYSLGNDYGSVLTCENKFFPRFASSAARQIGAERALAECFAVYGAMRYNKMRYVINFLIARRINLINIMSISYAKYGHVAGGMRPNFIPEAPDYFGLKKFNDFIATECFLMTLGEPIVKTALYIPIHQWWQNNEQMRTNSDEFFKFGKELEEFGEDFDIIDDYVICNGDISSYDVIYICKCPEVPENVKNELEMFISNGGKVYTTTKTNIKNAVIITSTDLADTISSEDKFFELNKNIRTSVRLFENDEKLIFVYNEGFEKTNIKIKSFENGYIYEVNVKEKKLYNIDAEVLFESGEEKFYYYTKTIHQAENHIRTNREIVPTLESARIVSRFSVENSDISLKEENILLESIKWPDNNFSGQILYTYKFELKDEDLINDAFLELYDVNNCCSIKINNENLDVGIFFPLKIRIPKEMLRKVNSMEILVGNTVAEEMAKLENDNEYVYGSYHHMAKSFEKESFGGGLLGKVLIKLICD